MRFADVFIRRPVFATMLVGSLVVLGLFSYRSLGLDLFPNIDFPIVTVTIGKSMLGKRSRPRLR